MTRKIVDGVPRLLDGLSVTRWLHPSVFRSILSLEFMPKVGEEATDEIQRLDGTERFAPIRRLLAARSQTPALSDF